MSDSSRWQRRSRSARDAESASVPTSKPPAPIILGLARPTAIATHPPDPDQSHMTPPGEATAAATSQSDTLLSSADSQQRSAGGEKPIVVLRSREEGRGSAASSCAPIAGGEPLQSHLPLASQLAHPSHAPYAAPQPRLSTSSQAAADASRNKLAAPPEMKEGVKIIDDTLRWIDTGIDWLVDQTDYLVVGVLGMQGSGKSTVLSLLAGNSAQDAYRNYIFQPQTRDIKEDALNQTLGVDMFVSPERIIFLDTQAALSPAVLDSMIRDEKKFSSESPENYAEIQSLQIASFLMTVCNVVIVVQDWFADLSFLRSLLTAEMLKPQTHPSTANPDSSQSATPQEDTQEFYPTVVFVQNRAGQDEFSPQTYSDMKLVLHSVFHKSKLHYRGSVSMHKDNSISSILGREKEGPEAGVNLFLLPTMEFYKNDPESIIQTVPEYRGFPSFYCLLRSFRNQLYSIPRTLITQTPLSERNWFHFAARTWEAVKKSPLFAEYNRLLP